MDLNSNAPDSPRSFGLVPLAGIGLRLADGLGEDLVGALDPHERRRPSFHSRVNRSNAALTARTDALNFDGGPRLVGAAKILLRAAVASLLDADALNATTPLAYHFWTVEALLNGSVQIRGVNSVLASLDRRVMLVYAAELDYSTTWAAPELDRFRTAPAPSPAGGL